MTILEKIAMFIVDHLDLDKESHTKIWSFLVTKFLNGNEYYKDKNDKYSVWLYSTKSTKIFGGAIIVANNYLLNDEEIETSRKILIDLLEERLRYI